MLTLAFSMILYGLLVKTSTLGSTDGFNSSRIQWRPVQLAELFEGIALADVTDGMPESEAQSFRRAWQKRYIAVLPDA